MKKTEQKMTGTTIFAVIISSLIVLSVLGGIFVGLIYLALKLFTGE